jgi:hypothetical protein
MIQAVLNTLFRLGLISADKFTQDRALDILTIEKEAAQATESNLLQNLLHILVNRANPSAVIFFTQ